VTAGGEAYHPNCFTCDQCNRPIESDYVVLDGKRYHRSCYERHHALYCSICSRIIEGDYLVDIWGNAYHTWHEDQNKRCVYCSRLISPRTTGGGQTYPDGRTVCNICAQSTITDPDEVDQLAREVAGHLKHYGIEIDVDAITVTLVDLKGMKGRTDGSARELRGRADLKEVRSWFGLVKEQQIDVYLLDGMPRATTIATLAHELMHVWQYQHLEHDLEPALNEGSCNFAAWLVLSEYEGKDYQLAAEAILEDPDYVYGKGARRVKLLADLEGVSVWLNVLRVDTDFPHGY
jgi:hypothetical protein